MNAVQHRSPRAGNRSAVRAWVALACTPVGWVLAIFAGFLWVGEACNNCGGVASWSLGTVPVVLLMVVAPTAAVILATGAARAGERSGQVAFAVSVLLLVGTFVVTLDFTLGWIIALVMVVAVLTVFGWRSRHKRLPPSD